MRSPLVLLFACACTQAPAPSPSAKPVEAAPPPSAEPAQKAAPPEAPVAVAVDPAKSSVVWWCTCYARSGGVPVTACRPDEAECRGLEKKASAGGGSGIIPGSLTHVCREVRGDHPGDALGGREKWQPSKKPGAWISSGACQLPGPADAPPPPSEAKEEEGFAVLSSDSFGGVKIGQSIDEVQKLLGAPQKRDTSGEASEATGLYYQSYSYTALGLEVYFGSQERRGPWAVDALRAKAPCAFRTSRGVGIGDPRSAVEAAYGKDRDPDTEPTEDHFVAGSIYGGVMFDFDPKSKLVTEIFFGAAAE